MKAQQRHQLKENDFLRTTTTVVEFANANRGPIAVGLAAAVVVAAVVGGWLYLRARTAKEAGELLGIATATAQSQIAPAPTLPGATQTPGTYPTEAARSDATIKALTQVITTFPGTDAAVEARYQLAAEYLAAGRASDAQSAFHEVAGSGSALYGPLGRLGEAQALMAAGKADDAMKIYTELAAERDTALPVDALLMQLAGAAQKAGKTQEARAAFKRVVDEFPESGYVADAKQQFAALN